MTKYPYLSWKAGSPTYPYMGEEEQLSIAQQYAKWASEDPRLREPRPQNIALGPAVPLCLGPHTQCRLHSFHRVVGLLVYRLSNLWYYLDAKDPASDPCNNPSGKGFGLMSRCGNGYAFPKVVNEYAFTIAQALKVYEYDVIGKCLTPEGTPDCLQVPWDNCQEGCGASVRHYGTKTSRNWCTNNNQGRVPTAKCYPKCTCDMVPWGQCQEGCPGENSPTKGSRNQCGGLDANGVETGVANKGQSPDHCLKPNGVACACHLVPWGNCQQGCLSSTRFDNANRNGCANGNAGQWPTSCPSWSV